FGTPSIVGVIGARQMSQDRNDGLRQASASASVTGVAWLVSLRPVPPLGGEVRTGLSREVRGYIDGVGIAQGLPLPQGHVGLDEARRVVQSGHAGPNVEGLRAPECREQIASVRPFPSLPIGSVTHRALLRVDRLAPLGIWRPTDPNTGEPTPSDL